MQFKPTEILLSPTAECNLRCVHCKSAKDDVKLSASMVIKFLKECKSRGIDRIGFTGGEPFLAPDFLCAVVNSAVKEGMTFNRIMTNGVWYRSAGELRQALLRLKRSGYDGSICVSVDAFHKQPMNKLTVFIKTALKIWDRPDIISIAYVSGAKEEETKKKLQKLFKKLRGVDADIKLLKIDLSPIGKAEKLKDPWSDRSWFREDHCGGPGNIFLIEPDGDVKPCCGYASDSVELSIGNIRKDSVGGLIKNAKKNALVHTIFTSGLTAIRSRLECEGIKFPGKASNHCYFCHYIINNVPRSVLEKCLN